MMIQLNADIQHLVKMVDKKSNKELYYILYDNDDEWIEISQDEYNNIRGK